MVQLLDRQKEVVEPSRAACAQTHGLASQQLVKVTEVRAGLGDENVREQAMKIGGPAV